VWGSGQDKLETWGTVPRHHLVTKDDEMNNNHIEDVTNYGGALARLDEMTGHLDNALVVVEEYVRLITDGQLSGTPLTRVALLELEKAKLATVTVKATVSAVYTFTSNVEFEADVPVWDTNVDSQEKLQELYGDDVRRNGLDSYDYETDVANVEIEFNSFQ
jgi:hypothetical protein